MKVYLVYEYIVNDFAQDPNLLTVAHDNHYLKYDFCFSLNFKKNFKTSHRKDWTKLLISRPATGNYRRLVGLFHLASTTPQYMDFFLKGYGYSKNF